MISLSSVPGAARRRWNPARLRSGPRVKRGAVLTKKERLIWDAIRARPHFLVPWGTLLALGFPNAKVVKVHVSHIRQKVPRARIACMYGLGYVLDPSESQMGEVRTWPEKW